ncbi:hypothetical protein JW766_00630 [Candidatus Dojkabacteria bacterium]|nr:hypothetical protein [Candidatus Dojkabacteria bacterium]
MKNNYLVINRRGKIFDPKEFLKNQKPSKNFRKFVEKEAFGMSIGSRQKSEYLKHADKLGFNWEPNADIGFMQYDYKAWLVMRLLKEYARQLVVEIGFPIYEVRGSNVFDMSYPVVEAYAKLYGDRLFRFKSGKKEVVMSYDASYPQFNLAGKYKLSYKDLPIAHFSISDCYRHEQSGECMLFYRLRRFFMPDLHPYFKSVNEAFEWYPRIERQILQAAKEVNRKYEVIAEIGSESDFEKYENSIVKMAKDGKRDILVEINKDEKDRYWIINVDYKIMDRLGQSREIGCIQIDVGNAHRLGIEYIDKQNKVHHPVIIHAAVPGGIDRFLYMLFDNFEECFPLWLYPIQIRLIPLGRKYLRHCIAIQKNLKQKAVRLDIDDRDLSVGKRVKQAKEDLIPFSFVIGLKELQAEGNMQEFMNAVERILDQGKNKPFLDYSWPSLVSKQVR